MKPKNKYVLITFEGGEGSGKSTQVKLLYEKLKRENYNCILLREPGSTKLSEKIRETLLTSRDINIFPLTELLLYQASRVQLIYEKIIPAKKNKQIVICDRFYDSTIAYQGFGRGLGMNFVEEFIKMSSKLDHYNIVPDITFYLDISPEKGLQRIKKNFDRLENEKINFHKKVRKGFLTLTKKYPQRIIKLNAEENINSLHKKICQNVVTDLGLHKNVGAGL